VGQKERGLSVQASFRFIRPRQIRPWLAESYRKVGPVWNLTFERTVRKYEISYEAKSRNTSLCRCRKKKALADRGWDLKINRRAGLFEEDGPFAGNDRTLKIDSTHQRRDHYLYNISRAWLAHPASRC